MRTEFPMHPRYADTMLRDAENGQMPVLSDVELLARSYLRALVLIADMEDEFGMPASWIEQ